MPKSARHSVSPELARPLPTENIWQQALSAAKDRARERMPRAVMRRRPAFPASRSASQIVYSIVNVEV